MQAGDGLFHTPKQIAARSYIANLTKSTFTMHSACLLIAAVSRLPWLPLQIFLKAIQLFLQHRSQDVGAAVFDKDDDLAVEFVTAAANLRSIAYDIPTQSLFAAKVQSDSTMQSHLAAEALPCLCPAPASALPLPCPCPALPCLTLPAGCCPSGFSPALPQTTPLLCKTTTCAGRPHCVLVPWDRQVCMHACAQHLPTHVFTQATACTHTQEGSARCREWQATSSTPLPPPTPSLPASLLWKP